MLFLRSIRLDGSDDQVFPVPAAAGEWAVPGSFTLLGMNLENPDEQRNEAFRHGFVGTESFGHAGLVVVADIGPAQLGGVVSRLTEHLLRHCGAPDEKTARRAAQEEVAFTLEIAAHPPGTLIAVQRTLTDEGIEEAFRTVAPPAGVDHGTMRLWGVEG